jgi:hypothetical protein
MKKLYFIILSLVTSISYSVQLPGGVVVDNDNNIINIATNTVNANVITNTYIDFKRDDGLCVYPKNQFKAVSNISFLQNVYIYTETNLPPDAKTNLIQISGIMDDTAIENIWQVNKSSGLKTIENVYVDFLTNDWTACLRNRSIISNDVTITVDNTSEQGNIQYLLILRQVDKPDYYNMAGEFQRFKDNIVGNGGIMSKVIKHE